MSAFFLKSLPPPFESLYLYSPFLYTFSETGQPRDSESFTLFCLLTLEKKRKFFYCYSEISFLWLLKVNSFKIKFLSSRHRKKGQFFFHILALKYLKAVLRVSFFFCVPDVFRPWIGVSDALAPILHLTVYYFTLQVPM